MADGGSGRHDCWQAHVKSSAVWLLRVGLPMRCSWVQTSSNTSRDLRPTATSKGRQRQQRRWVHWRGSPAAAAPRHTPPQSNAHSAPWGSSAADGAGTCSSRPAAAALTRHRVEVVDAKLLLLFLLLPPAPALLRHCWHIARPRLWPSIGGGGQHHGVPPGRRPCLLLLVPRPASQRAGPQL